MSKKLIHVRCIIHAGGASSSPDRRSVIVSSAAAMGTLGIVNIAAGPCSR